MCDRVNECEFVKELREQIKALKIELEKLKKQVKNPSNSSLPSSSDRNKKYYPTREKSGKKQGGQKGHNGSAKTLYDNPDEIIEFYPQKCSHCDNDQFIEKEAVLEQGQVIDIPPIQPYITEYQQKEGIPHLIRDCKYIIEVEKSRWAKKLKKFFEKIMEFRKKCGEYFNPLSSWYFRKVQRYKRELLEIFSKPPPGEAAKKLYNGLLPRLQQLTHFLDKKEVPYDNNGSERALRNRVINRKVAGCFRSKMGAVCHDKISSVIETAKKRKQNILDVLNTPSLLNQLLLQA